MSHAFSKIAANLGISIEVIILFVLLLGGLVFFVKGFQIGTIMEMIISALCFMGFYWADWNWVPALTCFFIFLVLLALSIIPTARAANSPYGGVT